MDLEKALYIVKSSVNEIGSNHIFEARILEDYGWLNYKTYNYK